MSVVSGGEDEPSDESCGSIAIEPMIVDHARNAILRQTTDAKDVKEWKKGRKRAKRNNEVDKTREDYQRSAKP